MVQLSTEVQLIKAVCTALSMKCNVLDSQHQKTRKDPLKPPFMGDHNKGIAFSSIRARVVRSSTCVTTTQAIFPCPTELRSNCLQ